MKKYSIIFLLISISFFVLLLPGSGAEADPNPYLKFCGANGTIFGTCHLLYTGKSKVLLDCGLFQEEGYPKREVDRRNRFLPFSPREIDCIFVSHAHGDHIGRIPYLVRKGFSARSTAPKPPPRSPGICYDSWPGSSPTTLPSITRHMSKLHSNTWSPAMLCPGPHPECPLLYQPDDPGGGL